MTNKTFPVALLGLVLLLWALSGVHLQDTRLTWILETAPLMVVLPVLVLTWRRFPLTSLVYALIAVHAVVLMVGGHYSYAKVPLGFWVSDWFGWNRNNYDKLGHFFQGFVPALCVREILLRTSPLGRGKWLSFISVCIPLAFSALYEMFEWIASLSNPTDTEAFLGTQGYIWDTQTDMFACLVGSVVALLLLSRVHDKFLQREFGGSI
jgi:putative membrane protein